MPRSGAGRKAFRLSGQWEPRCGGSGVSGRHVLLSTGNRSTSSRRGCRCWLGCVHAPCHSDVIISRMLPCNSWASHPESLATGLAQTLIPRPGLTALCSSPGLDFPILQSQGLLTFPGC